MFALYDLTQDRVTRFSDTEIPDPFQYANQKVPRFKCVETDIDLSENLIAALRLDSDGETLVNAYPGKTKAEQRELNNAADLLAAANRRKVEIERGIRAEVFSRLENLDWKNQRAEELDFAAGNNDATKAVQVEKQAIRDAGNAHVAALNVLSTIEDIDAFKSRQF
jgi:hypothetical protein